MSRSDPQRGSDVIQPRLRCEPLNSEGNSEDKTPSLSGASSDALDNRKEDFSSWKPIFGKSEPADRPKGFQGQCGAESTERQEP